MTRNDMLSRERASAADYRREASRRHKNPQLVAQLLAWADEHERRAEAIRCGPLFELMAPKIRRAA